MKYCLYIHFFPWVFLKLELWNMVSRFHHPLENLLSVLPKCVLLKGMEGLESFWREGNEVRKSPNQCLCKVFSHYSGWNRITSKYWDKALYVMEEWKFYYRPIMQYKPKVPKIYSDRCWEKAMGFQIKVLTFQVKICCVTRYFRALTGQANECCWF